MKRKGPALSSSQSTLKLVIQAVGVLFLVPVPVLFLIVAASTAIGYPGILGRMAAAGLAAVLAVGGIFVLANAERITRMLKPEKR